MPSISASGVKRQLIDLGATLVTGRLAVLFGAAVHQGSAVFAQSVHGKGWAGAVPQQPLQRGTVVRLNEHTGVHREAAVLVGQHLFGITTLQKTPAHEGAQDATA
jgi:hypothetical protein